MGQQWDQDGNQKLILRKIKINTEQSKTMGHSKNSPERETHSNTGLPQQAKNSKTRSNHTPKGTRKRTSKVKASRRKEIKKLEQK